MKKRNIMIIIGIVAFIVIIGGISYSYFIYNKDIGNVSLETGEISIDLSQISQDKTLIGVIPKSDSDGMEDDNYLDFTVDGTVDEEKIYYEVYIMPDENNTINTQYIKTYLTDQEDNVIKGITVYSDLQDAEITGGKRLYREVIELNNDHSKKTYTKDFRLRIWIDENYTETASKTFDFDVKLYAKNVDEDYFIPEGANLLRRAIIAKQNATTNSCNPIWIDKNGTENDTSDDITYFSGTNDCVDMNYVWYSGKLWRITAIYPDGAMKIVTQNSMTSISFNESNQVNFYTDANTTSYMYQWLNEDFYDTLYNANNIIDNTKEWDMGISSDIRSKPSESVNISVNVGLLNSYEYYNSYRCVRSETCTSTTYDTGYLNIGLYWWLLNPYVDSRVWRVVNSGSGNYFSASNEYGARPSIYLKSGLEFTGSGTSDNPYKIVGDKDTGQANELINTRLSGEYIKLKNGDYEQVFRIIGVEDNKTKIIAMNYADNKNTRKFATSTGSANTLWGSGTTTGADTWYTYLNDSSIGYLKNLKDTYGELFDSGLYYLGIGGYNYKLSVCANATSESIKVCNKTSDKGTFNIGLPRYGEMFAAQQKVGSSNLIDMWLISRQTNLRIRFVYSDGLCSDTNQILLLGARPTVHLKSTVKILSGTGTESDPYVVGL